MPPEDVHHDRRESDHSRVARIAWSPWANIFHLAGTGTVIVALVTLGGVLYSNQQSLLGRTDLNTVDIQEVDSHVRELEKNFSSLKTTVLNNERNIDRVEQQAAQDRAKILEQLNQINRNVDELNKYLRSLSQRSSFQQAMAEER